jgi:hypothetical protein
MPDIAATKPPSARGAPRLASSPEVAAERRNLGLKWLKLAEKAQAADRPFGRGCEPSAVLSARA